MKQATHLAQRLALPVALAGLWQLAVSLRWVNTVFVPPPADVLKAGYAGFTENGLLQAAASTTGRALLGLAIAVAVAVPAGLLFAISPLADSLTSPVREFFRALPTVTVIPALMVVVGPGDSLTLLAVAFGAVWPVLLSTMLGVRQTDQTLLDVARVHRLSAWDSVFRIRLPAALPQIMTGLRISLAIALVIALVVEMMSGHGGLGSLVVEARSRFRNADVFAIVAVIGVVGLALNALMVRVERRSQRDRAV